MKEKNLLTMKLLNVVTFLIMIAVNALANILPINGVTSGEASDSYPNLFAPAGITFSIWAVIYLLLGAFVIYQLGALKGEKNNQTDAVRRIGWLFIISSIANATWIFSWHYKIIPLSLVLMAVILLSLIGIYKRINQTTLSLKEKIFVRLPFSVYFGWITVAAIANVTTLLVSLGWKGFGIPEPIWMMVVVIVGLAIGVTVILKNKDLAYGLVILWAYTGILIKHLSPKMFNGEYIGVIITVALSLVVVLVAIIKSVFIKKKCM
jgi:hypothetical protein